VQSVGPKTVILFTM